MRLEVGITDLSSGEAGVAGVGRGEGGGRVHPARAGGFETKGPFPLSFYDRAVRARATKVSLSGRGHGGVFKNDTS
jgi:hypothetical protein